MSKMAKSFNRIQRKSNIFENEQMDKVAQLVQNHSKKLIEESYFISILVMHLCGIEKQTNFGL